MPIRSRDPRRSPRDEASLSGASRIQQLAGSRLYALKGNRDYGAGRFPLVDELGCVDTQ